MTDLSHPTPERRRRSAFVEGPAIGTEHAPARAGLRLHRALSTLERLAKAGIIQPRQADAGERLRSDYELGVEGAREATTGSASTTGWSYPEARLAALRRFQAARSALGPTHIVVLPIAIGVPGNGDVSISQLALALHKNRQEIAGILKLGLAELADHYGIAPT